MLSKGKRGNRIRRLLVLSFILLAAVGALFGATTVVSSMISDEQSTSMLTHTVQRGELLVTQIEEGDVESTENTDVKCTVSGGSTILWVIEDGTEVKKGDVLVRLDSSTIDNEIQKQKIALEKARSSFITAENEHATAVVSVREYEEGTFRKELQLIESNIALAEETLRSTEEDLKYAERMYRKGYVSDLVRESKRFAVQHARLELAVRRTEKDVLERFTRAKTLQELKGKAEAANAKKLSEKSAYELELSNLERLEEQKENCTIVAPKDGIALKVLRRWWGREPEVEQGAKVNESQTLIQLPVLSEMQVKTMVHESKVDQIKVGMSAVIRILDEEYTGNVTSVASQAKKEGWWSGNVKKFETIVKLNGKKDVKPGMTAEVEILISRHNDVLTLPVAAVIELEGKHYCWVKASTETQRRSLEIGPNNDQFMVVKDGVVAGEEAVLNPRAVVKEAIEMLGKPIKEENGEEGFDDTESSDVAEKSKKAKGQKDKAAPKNKQVAT